MNYSEPTVGETMKEIDCHSLADRYPKYLRRDAFCVSPNHDMSKRTVWKVIQTLLGYKSLLTMRIYAQFVEGNI
ncbi:hypothetical protein CEE34_00900 [Candidatus Aerophobetes bacterium Ae_b3a]|nr:MAG: hypothetical protein CEE34_00900 [Candidatus Aerophobetes bacterium Ae_b3a]